MRLLVLALASGCGLAVPYHAPDENIYPTPSAALAGSISVSVELSASLTDTVCGLYVYRANSADPKANLLASNTYIKRGYGAKFSLKPGTYSVIATGCYGKFPPTGTNVTVERSTIVEITWAEDIRKPLTNDTYAYITPPTPPDIHRSLTDPHRFDAAPEQQDPNCTPDGQDVKYTGGPDCCSGITHGRYIGNTPVRVCGPDQ